MILKETEKWELMVSLINKSRFYIDRKCNGLKPLSFYTTILQLESCADGFNDRLRRPQVILIIDPAAVDFEAWLNSST